MPMIVADTTCGLPRKMLEERCIPLVPQIVSFGEESYHDDKDLDPATFLSRLKASPTLPKTAAPEPSFYYPMARIWAGCRMQAGWVGWYNFASHCVISHKSGFVRSSHVRSFKMVDH